MKSKINVLLIAITLAFAGCTATKRLPSGTPASPLPTEKSLLWKISGNGLKKTSYLFGTIHIIGKEDFFMPQRVKDAFAKSSLVVFEIDMAEMEDPSVLLKMANGMMMPEGTTLKSLLNETDYQKVRKRLAELPYVSLMGDMAEQIKPLFISSMMAKSDVGEEIESYELVLMKMAKDQGKKTAGLESVDFQLGMFDSIPYKDQAEMLVKGLDTDEEAQNKVLDEMVRLYKAEDIGGLQLLIAKEAQGVGNFERLLLDKRNKNWSESMPKIMKQQAAFFAVGAGHLGGPKGVIALLRKSGYNVEAVMP